MGIVFCTVQTSGVKRKAPDVGGQALGFGGVVGGGAGTDGQACNGCLCDHLPLLEHQTFPRGRILGDRSTTCV